MLGDVLHDSKVALAFLTRLPVRPDRPWQDADLATSAPMFPLVGVVVGALGALAYAAATAVGLPPLLASILAITVLVGLTGALHEDGLADLADALGGRNRARRLEIMRDPRIGSFGAIALVLTLAARAGALAALAAPIPVAAALIGGAALSRALLPVAMLTLPQARAEGLAAQAGRPHQGRVAAGAAIALLTVLLLLPLPVALVASATAAAAAALMAWLGSRGLGGITGDVLGAVQQAGEIAFLLGVVAMMSTR